MAIRSARYLSGRDVRTGKADGIGEMEANVLMKDDVLTNWLEDEHFFAGIAMYLIAIDCIGCIFENIEKTQIEGNGIKRAYFTLAFDLKFCFWHNSLNLSMYRY